jgi:hypothetical protein
MRSILPVAPPSPLRVSALAFCAYGSACWRTARKHWKVSLDGAGVIAMNKLLAESLASSNRFGGILDLAGSLVGVGSENDLRCHG